MDQRKIEKVEFIHDTSFNRYGDVEIWATYQGSDELEYVLGYYSDEISFTADEIIGKTKKEVIDLFHKKDLQYLQS